MIDNATRQDAQFVALAQALHTVLMCSHRGFVPDYIIRGLEIILSDHGYKIVPIREPE